MQIGRETLDRFFSDHGEATAFLRALVNAASPQHRLIGLGAAEPRTQEMAGLVIAACAAEPDRFHKIMNKLTDPDLLDNELAAEGIAALALIDPDRAFGYLDNALSAGGVRKEAAIAIMAAPLSRVVRRLLNDGISAVASPSEQLDDSIHPARPAAQGLSKIEAGQLRAERFIHRMKRMDAPEVQKIFRADDVVPVLAQAGKIDDILQLMHDNNMELTSIVDLPQSEAGREAWKAAERGDMARADSLLSDLPFGERARKQGSLSTIWYMRRETGAFATALTDSSPETGPQLIA